MVSTRIVGLLLGIIVFTDAFVQFEHSILFDENDFAVETVHVPNYCNDNCRIYVSVPQEYSDIAEQIVVDNLKSDQTSLLDISQMTLIGDKKRQKGYLKVKHSPQVNFINKNADKQTAPILVWIVRIDAPNFNTAEVYNADATYRPPAAASAITILNAEPYVLTTTTNKGVMTVRAIAAGYDAVDSDTDKCTEVLQQNDNSTYQDIRVWIRSPLITLVYDYETYSETIVQIWAQLDDTSSFDLFQPAFVTSPGYIGCSTKTVNGQPSNIYRSSLYDSLSAGYVMKSDEGYSLELTADLNVDADHEVVITAKQDQVEDLVLRWHGGDGSNQQSITVSTNELTISWNRDKENLDQYFLVRIIPNLETEKSTSSKPEPEPVKTTTSEPEPGPCKATTWEPEPEPVRTTTAEPEPEPVHTTSPEPEPEPVHTTSPEPEPEPVHTTTPEPEPEPFHTTTWEPEPEPVQTTTSEPEPEPVHTTIAEPEPDPVKTTTSDPDPEPVLTTTPNVVPMNTTRRTPPTTTPRTTTYHPKSPTTMSTKTTSTTVTPTTSGAGYGASILLSILVWAVLVR